MNSKSCIIKSGKDFAVHERNKNQSVLHWKMQIFCFFFKQLKYDRNIQIQKKQRIVNCFSDMKIMSRRDCGDSVNNKSQDALLTEAIPFLSDIIYI